MAIEGPRAPRDRRVRPGAALRPTGLQGPLAGVAASVAAVAIVTGAISLLDPHVPVLSLGVLYVFAVLLARDLLGAAGSPSRSRSRPCSPSTSSSSTRCTRSRSRTTATGSHLRSTSSSPIVVGALASRYRQGQADPAEQRERESALLADIAARTPSARRAGSRRISLKSKNGPPPFSTSSSVTDRARLASRSHVPTRLAASPHGQRADDRGTLYTPENEESTILRDPAAASSPRSRHSSAVAIEREQLEREALAAGHVTPKRHGQDGRHSGGVA